MSGLPSPDGILPPPGAQIPVKDIPRRDPNKLYKARYLAEPRPFSRQEILNGKFKGDLNSAVPAEAFIDEYVGPSIDNPPADEQQQIIDTLLANEFTVADLEGNRRIEGEYGPVYEFVLRPQHDSAGIELRMRFQAGDRIGSVAGASLRTSAHGQIYQYSERRITVHPGKTDQLMGDILTNALSQAVDHHGLPNSQTWPSPMGPTNTTASTNQGV